MKIRIAKKINIYAVYIAEFFGWLNCVEPSAVEKYISYWNGAYRFRKNKNYNYFNWILESIRNPIGVALKYLLDYMLYVSFTLLLMFVPFLISFYLAYLVIIEGVTNGLIFEFLIKILLALIGIACFILSVIVMIFLLPDAVRNRKYGCFSGETVVFTPEGNKCIKDIEVGEQITSFDENNRRFVSCFVKSIKVRQNAKTLLIYRCGNSTPLEVTSTHKVLTEFGWIKCSDINSGDKLLEYSYGGEIKITKVHSIEEGNIIPVYHLYTSENFNYICDGVIAHNFSYFRRTRSFIHRVLKAGT